MKSFLPGSTIGFIGGGQLARMMAIEAKRMGYQTAAVDPDLECPAFQIIDIKIQGELTDLERLRTLSEKSDVLTLDTEHVCADLLSQLEKSVVLYPSASVMRVIQDRGQQRKFLQEISVAQARFTQVMTHSDLLAAAQNIGFPSVLKTCRSGYDGKGQVKVQTESDLLKAWEQLGKVPCILEAFIEFDLEFSVLLARDTHGEIAFFPIAENEHRKHILYSTCVPARIEMSLQEKAKAIGTKIAKDLGHVGMMAIEMFLVDGKDLLVNEIAPRVHNSGHYTWGACRTSQFEQHVRAVCGLPLGDATLMTPAVMINLLGDLWDHGEPDWKKFLSIPQARLHLYGKKRVSPGRKMGHYLILDTVDKGLKIAETISSS